MGLAVVTVPEGGMPVIDVTAEHGHGTPVMEAPHGYGIAVTKVARGGMPVIYAEPIVPPTPVINALEPDACKSGDPTFRMTIRGQGFFSGCVVLFDNRETPSVYHVDGTLSIEVRPAGWAAAAVPVQVHNYRELSNVVNFTFNPP